MTDMGWREASELHRREDNAACLYEVLVKFLNFSDLLFLYLLLLFTPSIVFDSFETPWKEDHQAPLSVGFPRQEYWSGLPFPPPEESSRLRDRTHVSCVSCIGGRFFTAEPRGKPITN